MQLFHVSARVDKHGIFSDRELSITAESEQSAKEIFSDSCSNEQYKIIGEIVTEQLISTETQDAPKPKKPKTTQPKAKKGK